MADYVRVMIAIATQWRVVQALGPAAVALAGVPLTEPVGPKGPPVRDGKRRVARPAQDQPQHGQRGWK